jgi:hypothetical protein
LISPTSTLETQWTDAGNKVVGRITDATGIHLHFDLLMSAVYVKKCCTTRNDGKSIASSCCQWSFEIDCINTTAALRELVLKRQSQYAWTTTTVLSLVQLILLTLQQLLWNLYLNRNQMATGCFGSKTVTVTKKYPY